MRHHCQSVNLSHRFLHTFFWFGWSASWRVNSFKDRSNTPRYASTAFTLLLTSLTPMWACILIISPMNCPNCSKVGLKAVSNFVNSSSRMARAVDSNSCWPSLLVPLFMSVNVALKIKLITAKSFVWTIVDPEARLLSVNKSSNKIQHLFSKNMGFFLLALSFLLNS